MKLRSLLLLALLFAGSTAVPAQAALFLGETFTISLNVSDQAVDANSTFEDINSSIGPFTVDNSTVDVGASLFDPNVNIEVSAFETENSATNSTVTITVLGRDSGGNFANPIADGAVDSTGDPFQVVWIDLGIFNGGTDGLFPSSSPFGSDFVVNSAEVIVFGTDGNGAFLTGGLDLFSSPPDPILGSTGFGVLPDISTLDMSTLSTIFDPGAEFAGMGLQFDVSAVPEPNCLAVLGLGMIGWIRHRRRD